MICRVWRGWTAPENADAYQELLLGTILPRIRARQTAGYLGVRVDRRTVEAQEPEVEFVTTMMFDSLDAVIEFAGPDYAIAVVPPAARMLLTHFDQLSTHYEVIAHYEYADERPAEPSSAQP